MCTHLIDGAAGMGFNRDEPSEGNALPDAWCDDCEIIRAAHDGWTEETGKLAEIRLLCSDATSRRASATHEHNSVTSTVFVGNVAVAKNGTGACLDFSYDSPITGRKSLQ